MAKGECANCAYYTEVDSIEPRDTLHNESDTTPDEPLYCSVCLWTYLSRASTTESKQLTQGEVWLYKSLAVIANVFVDHLHIDFHSLMQENLDQLNAYWDSKE